MSGASKHHLLFSLLYAGILCAFLIGFIFYVLLISSYNGSYQMIYQMMSWYLISFGSMIFVMTYYLSGISLAIGFGCTRRSWLRGSIAGRSVFAVITSLFMVFVSNPLSNFVYGTRITIEYSALPMAFALVLFLISFGGTLAYVFVRFGGKKTFLVVIVFFTLLLTGGISVAIVGEFDFDKVIGMLTVPVVPLVLLALCIPLELVSRRLVRNIAVRG